MKLLLGSMLPCSRLKMIAHISRIKSNPFVAVVAVVATVAVNALAAASVEVDKSWPVVHHLTENDCTTFL